MKRQNFSHMFQKKRLGESCHAGRATNRVRGKERIWREEVLAISGRASGVDSSVDGIRSGKEMESSRKSSGDVKIEYKQGMHEIVAMVYLASLQRRAGEDLMTTTAKAKTITTTRMMMMMMMTRRITMLY